MKRPRRWKVGERWVTRHGHVYEVLATGLASLRMLRPNVGSVVTQKHIPTDWKRSWKKLKSRKGKARR